jgi:hypothetical protein
MAVSTTISASKCPIYVPPGLGSGIIAAGFRQTVGYFLHRQLAVRPVAVKSDRPQEVDFPTIGLQGSFCSRVDRWGTLEAERLWEEADWQRSLSFWSSLSPRAH